MHFILKHCTYIFCLSRRTSFCRLSLGCNLIMDSMLILRFCNKIWNFFCNIQLGLGSILIHVLLKFIEYLVKYIYTYVIYPALNNVYSGITHFFMLLTSVPQIQQHKSWTLKIMTVPVTIVFFFKPDYLLRLRFDNFLMNT